MSDWSSDVCSSDLIDLRFVIATGMLIISYSLWEMAHWSLDVGPASIVTTGFLQGLGMGLVFMQLNTLAFATLDRRWRTDGTSLMNLLRSLGASAGISLCTTLLTQTTTIGSASCRERVSQSG